MINIDYTIFSSDRLIGPAKLLENECKNKRGARIGESTVASKNIHVYNPKRPEEIQILQNSDAGQLFYRRTREGEIFHLDIFHQCGQVNHRLLAAALVNAVEAHNNAMSSLEMPGQSVNPDQIDIQTNTGGGRITGSLDHGKKASLRRAHINHVHIAAMVPDSHIACLFYLVLAAESVICSSSLELRCVEKLLAVCNSGNQPVDLSEYTDHSDTMLKGNDNRPLSPGGSSSGDSGDHSTVSPQPSSNQAKNSTLSPAQRPCEQQSLQGLDGSKSSSSTSEPAKPKQISAPVGRLPDAETHIRRLLAKLTRKGATAGRRAAVPRLSGFSTSQRCGQTDWQAAGELDISATVHAAATRMITFAQPRLKIEASDLRFRPYLSAPKPDICLILDASASMSGERLAGAKALVLRLLSTSARRVSVISFQDDTAELKIPFTANPAVVRIGLGSIHAIGATPLAMGLKISLDYLSRVPAYSPLLILMSDGLPSYASGNTNDPVSDALKMARQIKLRGYAFTCVALTPTQHYLKELAEAAGGTMHICQHIPSAQAVETPPSLPNEHLVH